MRAKAYWEDRSGDLVVKYSPGDEIPDDHPKRDWLIRSGIAEARGAGLSVDSAPVGEESSAEAGRVEQDNPDSAPVGEESSAEAGRPAPTASVDAWRAYAKGQGIDTKGLSKPQLIKATK